MTVLAAGGLVQRRTGSEAELVVIHRPKYDDWSFPKGKLDPGESLDETAVREVYEETALHCDLREKLGVKEYPEKNKLVHYWVMEVRSAETFTPGEEVDEVRWVGTDQLPQLLTHYQDQELLADYLALRLADTGG